MAHGLLTQWEVTSCSSLPSLFPLHHAAYKAGASLEEHDDAPGPHIPGRLKSQHPQIPQQEKTINQLLSDGLSTIKAMYFPQHCDSDASAFRESWSATGQNRMSVETCLELVIQPVFHSVDAQLRKPKRQFCSQQEANAQQPQFIHAALRLVLTGEFPV